MSCKDPIYDVHWPGFGYAIAAQAVFVDTEYTRVPCGLEAADLVDELMTEQYRANAEARAADRIVRFATSKSFGFLVERERITPYPISSGRHVVYRKIPASCNELAEFLFVLSLQIKLAQKISVAHAVDV